MLAANIVEIDVDALGRSGLHGGQQIAAGAIVDDMIDAEALQPCALVVTAGAGDHGAALQLGNLRDDAANGTGGTGDKHHVTGLGLADLRQAGPGGEAGHAEHAQEAFHRNATRHVELFQCCSRGNERLAPAEHGGDDVALPQPFRVAFHHHADGTALQRLADLERRHITRPVIHAAPHVGVDRHELVLHQHFAGARSSQFATGERKIFGGGHADRAAGKADFAGNGHDGILLWLKTP